MHDRARKRGWQRVALPGDGVTYVAITSDGDPAMQLTLNPRLYPVEFHAKILRKLERMLLDPVDAPLDLAAGGETSAPLRLPDEPYQQGPRLVDK